MNQTWRLVVVGHPRLVEAPVRYVRHSRHGRDVGYWVSGRTTLESVRILADQMSHQESPVRSAHQEDVIGRYVVRIAI